MGGPEAGASRRKKVEDDEPARDGYRDAGRYSPSHCCFSYIFGLVRAGSRRPIAVSDAMRLSPDMRCEVASRAFDELWTAECAKARERNSKMSLTERAESDRLEKAFRCAQLAETKSD